MTTTEVIKWRSVNPTTYAWEIVTPQPARVILQRVERIENIMQTSPAPPRVVQKKTTSYILQVFDKLPAPNSIIISSADDSELSPLMEKLYATVATTATEENVRILKSLLPPDTPGEPETSK